MKLAVITLAVVLALNLEVESAAERMINSLHATWVYHLPQYAINGGYGLYGLPRTRAEAESGGVFKKVGSSNDVCPGNAKFWGIRYVDQSDPTLAIIYDIKGTIAGLQFSVPDNYVTYKEWKTTYYISDGKGRSWLTVYFVPQNIICNVGRDKTQMENEGTLTHFFIQKGKKPNQLQEVPLSLEQAESEGWKRGQNKDGCFVSMGLHRSYNMDVNMNCRKEYVPITLLFNRKDGKTQKAIGNYILTGFVFIINAPREDLVGHTKYYDNPPSNIGNYGNTLDPVPECFGEDSWKEIPTAHIYFNHDPYTTSKC